MACITTRCPIQFGAIFAIENCPIQFVRRQANSVAHCLSRVSRFYVSLDYFDFTS